MVQTYKNAEITIPTNEQIRDALHIKDKKVTFSDDQRLAYALMKSKEKKDLQTSEFKGSKTADYVKKILSAKAEALKKGYMELEKSVINGDYVYHDEAGNEVTEKKVAKEDQLAFSKLSLVQLFNLKKELFDKPVGTVDDGTGKMVSLTATEMDLTWTTATKLDPEDLVVRKIVHDFLQEQKNKPGF